MMGPIISSGMIISLFAIAAPFVFVLAVIAIVTGKKEKSRRGDKMSDEDAKMMDEIYRGLRDLNRRIDNLETLYNDKKRKER